MRCVVKFEGVKYEDSDRYRMLRDEIRQLYNQSLQHRSLSCSFFRGSVISSLSTLSEVSILPWLNAQAVRAEPILWPAASAVR